MSKPIPLGSIALALARAGVYVFPGLPMRKQPAIKTGFKGATRSPKKISSWWAKVPMANICIATEPSGLVVVDCDAGKPWPLDGEPPIGVRAGDDVLIGLAEDAGVGTDWLWSTPSVVTPSGGLHLYFRVPEGVRIRSRANVAPWIDVRGAGGYVVGPFSRTEAGHYRPSGGWEQVVEVDADLDFMPVGIPQMALIAFDPPPLPGWLRELLATKEEPATEVDVLDLIRARLARAPVGSTLGYAEAALAGETEKVRSAIHGGRNYALNGAAFALGTLVGAGMLAEAEVVAELESAARSVGLGDVEIQRTMRSGLRSGKASPRQVSTSP